MPQVSINIANRTYELACGEGEEERVHELAAYVDEKVTELRKQYAGRARGKLLVFAALLLAEESREARGIAKQAETARASATDSAETLGHRPRGADHLAGRQDREEGQRRGLRSRIAGRIAAGRPECLHWGGADFCAVRGSLKTPGPIRSPGNCSWP